MTATQIARVAYLEIANARREVRTARRHQDAEAQGRWTRQAENLHAEAERAGIDPMDGR